jgi:hypothetical protein
MDYILYSTPVKLRHQEVQVPPISMYHMKRLLELRDKGVNLEDPTYEDLNKILSLIGDILRENHPELTDEVLEKELDVASLREVMKAIQGLPKNSTAQIGSQTSPILSQEKTEIKS